MTLWHTVLIAAIVVAGIKVLGHLVPTKLVEAPRPRRTLELLTIALLAGLVAVQTVGAGQAVHLDARLPAVGLAAVLFWLRVPFIVVIMVAAATAAAMRWFFGWQ